MSFTEQDFENAIIELLRDELGYGYIYGPDVERDYRSPLHEEMLLMALTDINPQLTIEAIHEAIYKLKNYDSINLLQKNQVFMDYLQNGIEVSTMIKGEMKYDRVQLIDDEHPEKNIFYTVNQWTVVENATRRADVVIFINGLPLVVIELKSCSREETDASAANANCAITCRISPACSYIMPFA